MLINLKAKKEDRERFGTAFSGALGDNLVSCDLVESTEVVESVKGHKIAECQKDDPASALHR